MQDLVAPNDQLTSKDLFESFKMQLAKDFEQSNFQADFINHLEPDYAGIHEKIIHELQVNETRADTNIMQLLYRIDISEAQLKSYLSARKDRDNLRTIADLIIKRVLQKVVIKRSYKMKENA